MKAGIVFSTCEEQPASVAGTGCKRLKPVGGAVLQVPFLGPLSCCRVLLPAGLREWDAGCPAGLAQPWTSGCLRERLPSKLCVGPRVCACPALLLLGDPSGSQLEERIESEFLRQKAYDRPSMAFLQRRIAVTDTQLSS